MRRFYQAVCAAVALGGCASGPAVRGAGDLPIKKVVLYRSGVGYFERQGSFEGDALTFAVKKREVGDFLASLTAVEQGSGGVRSISFDVPEAPPVPTCEEEDEPCPEPADEGEQRVDVELMLDGDAAHELDVAYVVGSPIWRPSYRVVFDEGEAPLLQAWAVVQNSSGEDWRNVHLSLTTGAPISFRSDLGTPITPERPLVSDTGEVVSRVPTGETALARAAAPAMPPPPPEADMASMEEDGAEREYARKAEAAPKRARRPNRLAVSPAPSMSSAGLEQSVVSRVQTQALSGAVTRYDLDHVVTIPDGGSTMVAIASARVAGERAHLFAPEPGVALSYQHPFSVARLVNGTGAVLERGPISVLADGAFLGQGVLETLPRDASAFVPFAVDKSLVVETSQHYDQQQGALVRVRRGMVTVERFSQRKTRYTARNGSDEVSKLYVRHERWGEAELVDPPAGTELLPQRALVPIEVDNKSQRQLEVIERTPIQTDFAFTDQPAADAIRLWLSGPAVDAAQGAALEQALTLREELVALEGQIGTLTREQRELAESAEETRDNLKAIAKVATARDLRARLVTRLEELDARLAELTKQLVEARTKKSELEVRLSEALQGVSLTVK